MAVDVRVTIAVALEPLRHGLQREVGRIARVDFIPGERGRYPRVGPRPYRERRAHGAILGVLVVVDEDAVTLFLPPLAGGNRRRAALHFARQRHGGAPHLREGPPLVDANVDMDAARTRGLGPANQS